ncbi:MAG TPA: hypothetical protein VHU24_12225 [Solirubrobacterales bacterium]|nr:hypothetical protein [Solirubrobacterales bacterium]
MMAELVNLGLTAEDERVKSVCLVAPSIAPAFGRWTMTRRRTRCSRVGIRAKLTPEERDALRALLEKMVGKPG